MILTEERRSTWRKSCPNDTMSATNGLISNPALRGEGAATNRAYHTAGFKCDDRHE